MSEKNETPAIQPKSEWTIAEALQFANTLSNHGWTREANADAASSCIYALCRNLRERGDSAAMREALEYLLKERDILDFCHNNLGSKTWEDWDKVYKVLRKIIEKAMRALAAPPRNCDVYNSESCRMAYHLHGDGILTMQAFANWLFATATTPGQESEVKE